MAVAPTALSSASQARGTGEVRKTTSRSFRNRLLRARRRRGWSQADLASHAGLQQSAVSHYENGARRPSFANLRKLATALEVSTDYLVGHAPRSQQREDDLVSQLSQLRPAERKLVRSLVAALVRRR